MLVHRITKEFVCAIHAGKSYNLNKHHLKPHEFAEIMRLAKIMLGQNYKIYTKVGIQ